MKIFSALLVVSFLAVQFKQGYGAEIRGRIFGGAPATRGQFPYQALILSSNKTGPENTYYTCGGSLISTKYVLTAAHCVYGYYKSNVILGVISTVGLYPQGSFHDEVMVSKNVRIHPKYKPLENDIATIKLNTEAPLSDLIATIMLPNYSWRAIDYYKDKDTMVSGFGIKNEGDNSPATLAFTKQIVMGQDECKTYYKDLLPGMVCTERTKIRASPCEGDSGGPLTLDVGSEKYLIGAVSFSKLNGCTADNTYPEVYTNVAWYLPFIKKSTGLKYKN